LSRKLSPQALLETARAHWQIENGLHCQSASKIDPPCCLI
jgi:predicted transposase YbfD/YdcC